MDSHCKIPHQKKISPLFTKPKNSHFFSLELQKTEAAMQARPSRKQHRIERKATRAAARMQPVLVSIHARTSHQELHRGHAPGSARKRPSAMLEQ
ncbi:MAG: hypothetical protein Q4A98_07050 [Comamonadaceae bacterium]|nr:hypothetical protein [Comamonadaceae bacterium]